MMPLMIRLAALSALLACGSPGDERIAIAAEVEGSVAQKEFTEPAQPTDSISFAYNVVSQAENHALMLRLVGDVSLGATGAESPVDVRDLRVSNGQLYVLDAQAHQLRGYDGAGRSLFVTGTWGSGPGEMSDPTQLGVHGDTLILLDLTHDDHLKKYSLTGQYLGAYPVSLREGGSSLVLGGPGVVIATLVPRPQGDRYYSMLAMDLAGHVRWRGCQSDPVYAKSDRNNGLIGAFAFRQVTQFEGRVYCMQPITPVVQAYDSSGGYVGTVRRAPWFYLPPIDEIGPDKGMPSTKGLLRFQARWTKHHRFFPFAGGFLSVYEQQDTVTQRPRFRLFVCDSSRAPHSAPLCATSDSPGQPVALMGSDTLWTVERGPDAGAPLRLRKYLMDAKR